ncbi:GSCOCG00009633001-RA-CDS [Cotesia congregata]|nr:GSCOCG00009633001-RA-CDS [Cotesia congregata]
MFKIICSFCFLLFVISESLAKPMIYKRNQDNIFERIMVPVSSTVIPLPAYKDKYKYDFTLNDKQHHAVHNFEGRIKLITGNID